MNHLDILTKAAELGYSPWLIYDDDGHWAVVDDGGSTVRLRLDAPFYFSGTIQPPAWHDTPEEAIEAYAFSIDIEEPDGENINRDY